MQMAAQTARLVDQSSALKYVSRAMQRWCLGCFITAACQHAQTHVCCTRASNAYATISCCCLCKSAVARLLYCFS